MAEPIQDPILTSFLTRQFEQIRELASQSDVVEILQHGPPPPEHYILRFHCKGLVQTPDGIAEAQWFDVGFRFPRDYLRRAQVPEVLTWLWPPNIFHPNVGFPFICVGDLHPGTELVDLVYRIYEIITYHKRTVSEHDALNKAACAWARRNHERFPLERRPLRRRELSLRVSARTQSVPQEQRAARDGEER